MCGQGKYNNISGCRACSNTVDTDCTLCPIGTYSTMLARNSSECDLCKAGSFSVPANIPGAISCGICQNGTYSLDKAGVCIGCPLGWYAPPNSSACTACPVNTFLDVSGKGGIDACKKCPDGTVSSRLGNSDPACSACSPGSYQLNGVCASCPAGTYSRIASVVCSQCPAGSYSLENATGCTVCPAGKFSGNNASGACQSCAIGSYAEEPLIGSLVGASLCLLCPVGWISAGVGARNCSACQSGSYAASGSGICLLCPAGSWGIGDLGTSGGKSVQTKVLSLHWFARFAQYTPKHFFFIYCANQNTIFANQFYVQNTPGANLFHYVLTSCANHFAFYANHFFFSSHQ